MRIDFLKGFIKQCMDKGFSEQETGEAVGQYVNTALLSQPDIRKGCAGVLDSYDGPLSKSAIAKAMHPAFVAKVIEHTIHEGKSAGAQAMRCYHPAHTELTNEFLELMETNGEHIKAAASLRSLDTPDTRSLAGRFQRMPLSDKLTLLVGMGGTAGGLASAIAPRAADSNLGAMARIGKGAMRGASIAGAGVLGGELGGEVGSMMDGRNPTIGPHGQHWLGSMLGAGTGMYAAKRLTEL